MFVLLRTSILKTTFHAWLQYHSMKQTELVSIGGCMLCYEWYMSSIESAYICPTLCKGHTIACWQQSQEKAVSPVWYTSEHDTSYCHFFGPFILRLLVYCVLWRLCTCVCVLLDITVAVWFLWTFCRYFSAWKEYHNQVYEEKTLKLKGLQYRRYRMHRWLYIFVYVHAQ